MIPRNPEHVMVPGSMVMRGDIQVQLWVGDKHERNSASQAAALNRVLDSTEHKVVPVWVERPERKR